jgi:prepilin-type N-terminal cleavage/methylation domain-containing protein
VRTRAFTITELLVVITVFVIMAAIAVPAFTTLISGSERTLSENQLRVGISAGRDAAIRSDGGDGGVLFVHQTGPDGAGRIVMIPVVQVASIDDIINENGSFSSATVKRDVFAPIANAQAVAMPRGWAIRGYAPPGTINDGDNTNGWFEWLGSRSGEGNWVYPETDFYDRAAANLGSTGWRRQSFMIRFAAGTGVLRTDASDLALVVDPSAEDAFRTSPPWSQARVDRAAVIAEWARRTARRTDVTPVERARLIGDTSIDTVLARPVTELALYNESSLASALGLRGTNRETGSLYLPVGNGTNSGMDPEVLGSNSEEDVARDLSLWISGRFERGGNPVPSDARVFAVSKYLGGLTELKEATP